MGMIDKDTVINMINAMREAGYCDAREIRDRIMFMPEIDAEHVNRAEILRLLNEIEDAVNGLCKTDALFYYSRILELLKAIGKELGDAGSKTD